MDMLPKENVSALAQAIHGDYQKNNPGSRYDMPWDELPEDIKQSNRDQVHEFIGHITFLGLTVRSANETASGIEQFTDLQAETVAERIHKVWAQSKKAAGWIYGANRDDERKVHPCLVPYAELPEVEKDKDRALARNMLKLLNDAGVQVYRQ